MIIATPVPNNYLAPWKFVKAITSTPYKFISYEGPLISHNRNVLYQSAVYSGEDILFVDSDMTFTKEDAQKMEEHLKTLDVVTGLFPLGFHPYKAPIYERLENDYKLIEPKKGLTKIGACGGAFLGVSKRIYPYMEDLCPFENIMLDGKKLGEDISFCHRVNTIGAQIWLDTDINIGHLRLEEKKIII